MSSMTQRVASRHLKKADDRWVGWLSDKEGYLIYFVGPRARPRVMAAINAKWDSLGYPGEKVGMNADSARKNKFYNAERNLARWTSRLPPKEKSEFVKYIEDTKHLEDPQYLEAPSKTASDGLAERTVFLHDPNEADFQGGMAKSQLHRIREIAGMLDEMLVPDDQLPAWVLSHISDAANNLNQVFGYMEPKAHEGGMRFAHESLSVVSDHMKAWAAIVGSAGAGIGDLATELNASVVRKLTGAPTSVPRWKGALKAFSFHWSNAQAKWDVIQVTMSEFPYQQDGADFIVFVAPAAVSPLGKPWSLVEMRYVAQKLRPHPGYAGSVEGGQAFY